VSFPSLPTDNLYKFIALSGVVLVVAGFYLPWHRAEEIWDRLEQVKAESAVLTVDVQYLLDEAKKAKSDSASDVPALRKTLQELERRKAVQEVKVGSLERLTLNLWLLYAASLVLTAVGVVMMKKGFKFWYERVQQPMDLALRRDSAVSGRTAATDSGTEGQG
jgi:hypothetical protein